MAIILIVIASIVPGARPISSSGRTLSNFCAFGVSAAATVHIGTAPLRPGHVCKRHRSGATFFQPLAPRNPDLPFEVNRRRDSQVGQGDWPAEVDPKIENAIRASLSRGVGILKTAGELQVGSGTVSA
jgi:hypothetical protein